MLARLTLSAALGLVGGHLMAQSQTDPALAADAYPAALTPTRLRQSLQDIPASVTIITAETLSRFGITDVAEALRLVPGMAISQISGNDYRINYHGTNILTPRRMNVLIDGVSAYQPAFARVDWKNLPVIVEDIDRIEVTRGPNSASYGPNSMLGVINIITKHPNDVESALVSATTGALGTTRLVGRYATTVGGTTARLTVSKEKDRGYDVLGQAGDRDGTDLDRLSFRSQTTLGESLRLDLDAGLVSGLKESVAEQLQVGGGHKSLRDAYGSALLTKRYSPNHELQVRGAYWSNKVRQEWLTCAPTALLVPELFTLWRANPSYAINIIAGRLPSGGSASDDVLAGEARGAIAALGARAAQPTCGIVNQNLRERRASIELQDTYIFSEQLRAVSGVGARRQWGTSDTYLGGTVRSSTWWAFGNAEYRPFHWISLNGGAYTERDNLSGRTDTSPRVAANFKLGGRHAFRLVWSRGTRSPDIQEQRANWSYTATDVSPPLNGSTVARYFQSVASPGGLRSERITTREIGYLFNQPSLGLLLDVKVFDDRLTSLISEKLQLSSFVPTNTGSVELRGAELQAGLELTSEWSAFVNYAYLDSRNASNPNERTQYSRHSGSVGVSHRLGDGWRLSGAYYGASGDGIGETHFGRTDLVVSKELQISGSRVRLSAVVRRLDNKAASIFRDVGATRESRYEDRFQVFGNVQVTF